ncbi:Ferulic acid decarboxylase [Lachnellula subtilissima]|uniref:Ferulic acid decarboxylase 1 n=1 Tax=Lachnellula subtilissima TaxID=602034 RepID=A0A8H8UF07_9HELO|nr:Ferulic acid decarboxylase [Lachnellula subtilissima]
MRPGAIRMMASLTRTSIPRVSTASEPPHLCFRSFVDALREDNDLAEINEEIDPYLEAAAITRRASETLGKAPLMNNLKGNEHGLWRILGAPACLRSEEKGMYGRLARHVGLPVDATMREVMDQMLSAKHKEGIKPVVLETGPCKENIISGDQIDLTKLPSPWQHGADGGAYLQSYGVIRDQWKAIGKDVPWACAFGVPPAAIMASSMPLPDGVSEGEYVGCMTGAPLKVVKCENNDLYVPATSEIVLEGTISITERGPEGPYGEMHGYTFRGDVHDGPLMKVDKITYRDNAILPMSVPGRAVDETHTLIGTLASCEMRQILQDAGMPVTEVWTPFEAQAIWAVIKIDGEKLRALKTTSEEFCRKIAKLLFYEKRGMMVHRLFIVGDDIDVYNFKDVMWAFSTRCRPGTEEYFYDDVGAMPLIPFMSQNAKLGVDPWKGGKIVSDCLLPQEYTTGPNWETGDFEHAYPKAMQEKILKNWSAMGFDN